MLAYTKNPDGPLQACSSWPLQEHPGMNDIFIFSILKMQQRWCASPVAALSAGFTSCRKVNGWAWQPIATGHNYMPCLAIASSRALGCLPVYATLQSRLGSKQRLESSIWDLGSGAWCFLQKSIHAQKTCLSNCWAQICRTYTAHSPCLHQHQDCSHLASVPGSHVTVEQHAQMPLL